MAIIIGEGVNRTGKTTTGTFLKQFGYNYYKDLTVHEVKLDVKQECTKASQLSMAKLICNIPNNVNLFIDRFHLSEYTYGLVERNYKYKEWLLIDELFAKHNVKLLYFTDSIERINRRANKNLVRHKDVMDELYRLSGMTKMKFNLGEDTILDLFRFCELT